MVHLQVYPEGTHLMVPWFERPIIYDVRARPHLVESTSGSRDLQMVHSECYLNFFKGRLMLHICSSICSTNFLIIFSYVTACFKLLEPCKKMLSLLIWISTCFSLKCIEIMVSLDWFAAHMKYFLVKRISPRSV